MVFDSLKKLISDKIDTKINRLFTTERLLGQFYISSDGPAAESGKIDQLKKIEYGDPYQTKSTTEVQGLPVPPLGRLTMQYCSTVEGYIKSGEQTTAKIRAIEEKYGLAQNENRSILDWGCTTGRVLRHFAEDTNKRECWGIDIDRPSIDWAKANLSPPFNFLCCSAYPYLPFPDNEFSLIYGMSVMTHLSHFRDMWLMELRRILCPNGLLILTIHDESTVSLWQEGKLKMPWWVQRLDLDEVLKHEFTIFRGDNWANSYTIFQTEYIRREWGRYLEVLEIEPSAEGDVQAVVIMRKK